MNTKVWKRFLGAVLRGLSLIGILSATLFAPAGSFTAPGLAAPASQGGQPGTPYPNGVTVSGPVTPADTKGLPPALPEKTDIEDPLERQSALPLPGVEMTPSPFAPDPLWQQIQGATQMPATLLNFEGISATGVLPPDTDGQIGPDHYVQIVNTSGAGSAVRVFDKTDGTALYSFDLGNLWPAGTVCHQYGYGDPVVLYDQLADRWLLTQFVNGAADYHECFAVSKGHIPTNLPEDWWLYDFTVHGEKFNDYPKIGVWPDGYYMMAHQFTTTWAGTGVWVFDRTAMIKGEPASFQYKDLFPVNADYGGMLPANWMGIIPPPAGSPNYFVEVDRDWSGTDDVLTVFGFHVDWQDPAQTSFDVVGELVVAEFNAPVCNGYRGQCIDQPGGAPKLEAIADRLMMHAWYRNFGDHEAIVFNHTVDASGSGLAGIRWYELRKTTPAPTGWGIHQQGTYAPDEHHRWMGSIAMDHVGNLALGYSVSSQTVYPSIRYAGRLAGDPLNSLPQAESSIIEGGGAQTHAAARWGDYSAMSVDPVDDCTFWYTQEYVPAGQTVWSTRIASFRFPNCAIGDQGTLEGTVTNAATSAPIEGAAVQATSSITLTSGTTTEADGSYTLPLLLGTYEVTASAYGYRPETVSGVEILSSTVTTQDFSLTPAITYTISGTVTDAAAGWPLYARIEIEGYPGDPVWTDPLTGQYEVSLAEGITYTLRASAFVEGYLPEERTLAPLESDREENFALQADMQACLAPGYAFDYAFFEDFELSDGGYTISGTVTSWAWGMPTSGPGTAHSGANVWATNLDGNYGPGEDGYIVSPVIDLSPYTGRTPILEWWQWLRSENNFDRASVEASKDGGATWERVWGELSGEVDLAWARRSVILDPSYATDSFRLRFFFHSDSSIFHPGWYIDDIGLALADYTPPEVYFSQDFETETFPPDGWSSYNLDHGGSQWERTTSIFHGGGAAGRHTFAPVAAGMQDGWLVTPSIDLPAFPSSGGGGGVLHFWERTLYANDYFKHSLWVCTGDCGAPPANYTELAEFAAPTNLWREQVVGLEDYAEQSVTLAFRYEGVYADAWYLDDIRVVQAGVAPAPEVQCVVQPGGLVVGNVYDANDGAPLNGATVQNDSGEATTAQATPDDPAVEEAFYTLFSPEGTHVFTSTMEGAFGGGYLPDVETVGVVLSDTVQQDFSLSAGALAVSPPALTATLELGGSLTETLTLSNTGQATVTFQIVELPLQQVSGLEGELPEWTKTSLENAKRPPEQPRHRTPAHFILGNVYLAADVYEVLILTPDVGSGGGNVNTLLAALAPFPDLHVTVWNPDAEGTPEAAELQPYDVVIVGNDVKWVNMDKAAAGDILADYIDAGGKVIEGLYIQSHDDWGFSGRYMTGGYSPLTRATRDVWGQDSLRVLDAAHPVMLGVGSVSDNWGHQDPGVRDGASLLAQWRSSNDPYIAVNENVVALNQLLHHQSNWAGDVGLVLHNAVLWLAGATESGVPWLAEEPISGTLGVGATQPVSVTFDAAAVNQPGDYHALLRVESDTPAGPLNVPVSMTVTAPPDYGLLSGTVFGLRACDEGEPVPLSNAQVQVQSSLGVTWTVGTSADGAYHIWLDEDGNPYTLTASAPVYLTSPPVSATVTAGITTTVDFSLRLDAPCLSFAPESFDVRVDQGENLTTTLVITNTGAGEGTFEVSEQVGTPVAGEAAPGHSARSDYPALVDPRTEPNDTPPQPPPSGGRAGGGDLAPAGWGTGASMPGPGRYRAASACNELPAGGPPTGGTCSQVWVFGGGESGGDGSGSDDVMYYDVVSDSWTTGLAPIPNPGQNWQIVHIDGKFYLPGGYNGAHHNWLQIYDVQSNTWSAGANMPAATTPMAAAWNGKLFIFGGNPGPSSQVAMYDPLTDAWTAGLAPMPTARSYGRAVTVGDDIYVVGGANPTSAVERYHPETDTWESLPPLPQAAGDMSLFAAGDTGGGTGGDYLYSVGGISDYLTWTGLNTVVRYALLDAPGGTWEALAPAPGGIGAAAFSCAADKMWSIGGQDENGLSVAANRYLDEGLPCASGAAGSDVPWLSVEPITGTIAAGGSAAVQVTFTALPSMTVGAPYTATLRLSTNDLNLGFATIPVTLTVGAAGLGVDLEPESSTLTGAPGSEVTHVLTLTNHASQALTYALAFTHTASEWGVALEQASFTLGPGAQVQLLVRVAIPADAAPLAEDVITLTVTRQDHPDTFDSVELRTRAFAALLYFIPFLR